MTFSLAVVFALTLLPASFLTVTSLAPLFENSELISNFGSIHEDTTGWLVVNAPDKMLYRKKLVDLKNALQH